MLSSLRGKKNSTLLYIIIGLLVVGLIGFGGNSSAILQRDSLGKVGKTDIAVNDYANILRNQLNGIAQRAGRPITLAEAQGLGVLNNVLASVVRLAAIDDQAAEIGLSIGDEAVAESIQNNRAFQELDGRFNKDTYRTVLRNSGLTQSDYERATRRVLTRGLLERAVRGGIALDKSYALKLAQYAQETRVFDWVQLDKSWLSGKEITPTEEQLSTYYTENLDIFTTLLTRHISYIHLSPQRMGDDITIEEDALRDDYDAQIDRFTRPAIRAVERIVLSDEEDAKTIKAQIADNTLDFDALLEERGLNAAQVDLGEVERDQLEGEAKSLFDSVELGVYGPFDSLLGPAIYRVNAAVDEETSSFETVSSTLREEAVDKVVQGVIADAIEEIDDLLAAGATLEEIASTTKAEFGEIRLDANSNTGIAAYEAFRNVANQATPNNFPQLFDLSDGGAVALRVNRIEPARTLSFTEAQNAIRGEWKREEELRLLEIEGQKIADMISAGTRFSTLGLEPQSATIRRSDPFEGVAREAIERLFAAKKNEIVVTKTAAHVFISRVKTIFTFDPQPDSSIALLEDISATISQSIGEDLYTQYINALETRAGIRLDQVAIDSLNAQIFSNRYGYR